MQKQTDEAELEEALLNRLQGGDQTALAQLFDRHRERLWRMVRFRMNPQIAGRVDAEDILQESFLNAASRVEHFLKDSSRSIFVWFRLIVRQTMIDVHRRHVGAEKRNVAREVSLRPNPYPQATSISLAAGILESGTSPSGVAVKREGYAQLETAIASMSELDQEIIALRHFEDLTNAEVAELLNIGITAASNRYVRAISRLKEILAATPGFGDVSGDSIP